MNAETAVHADAAHARAWQTLWPWSGEMVWCRGGALIKVLSCRTQIADITYNLATAYSCRLLVAARAPGTHAAPRSLNGVVVMHMCCNVPPRTAGRVRLEQADVQCVQHGTELEGLATIAQLEALVLGQRRLACESA